MKKIYSLLFIFLFFLNAQAASVPEKIVAYLFSQNYLNADKVFSDNSVVLIDKLDGAGPVIEKWNVPDAPIPDVLPSDEDTLLLLQEFEEVKNSQRQASKPLEQRQYENAFFALTEQVLTLSSDPRVGQTPPVKLGFDELNALLESLFDSDMATATKLSIKLLSIDSALKRYNTLWWDDAIQHEIPEE